MRKTLALIIAPFVLTFAATPGMATGQVTVMTSGGFARAYDEVIPDFERDTGIKVTTLSGASQGTGPKTIKAQLASGTEVDVVILSKEGLNELIAAGRIVDGSEGELATSPLAAAVQTGSPKPDISTMEGFKKALLKARLVVMPGSTSGIFLQDKVFGNLGIAGKVSSKLVARGIISTGMLAAGEADLAIGPASELIGHPGIETIGLLPQEAQLTQVFTAAIVKTAHHSEEAKRLIAFLASDRTVAAIKKAAMEPVGNRSGH